MYIVRILIKFAISCGLVVLVVGTGKLWAQKGPQLGYAFPPSIQVGRQTQVHLGGFDFTTDLQWFVHDERIELEILGSPGEFQITPPPYWSGPRASSASLPIPREVPSQLRVSADSPSGFFRWQVANANGVSNTGVIYRSQIPEVLEHRSRNLPQRLPSIPIGVSGRLSRLTEVDIYELQAPADGLVSVDLMARRLGSNFNGAIEVRDAQGTMIVESLDTQGIDGAVTFFAKRGEIYSIHIFDTDFRGDRSFVYRVAVTPGPRVQCSIPASGMRGTTCEVELIGVGLATGQPNLESFRVPIEIPNDAALQTYTQKIPTPGGQVEFTIPVSNLRELGDIELDAANQGKNFLAAPVAVTCRIPGNDHERRFTWTVKKGETWSLELQSHAIGGVCDMTLLVLDPSGKKVGENDDANGSIDAALQLKAADDGVYSAVCRYVGHRRGTADEVFRLVLDRPEANFELSSPQRIEVPLGGKTDVSVQVVRLGDYGGEILLDVEGLPLGVTKQGDWKIPGNKSEAKVTLVVASDAEVVGKEIRIFGTGQLGDQHVTRFSRTMAGGNLCPRSPSDNMLGSSLLAITMQPPFEVRLLDKTRQRDVPRGSTCLAELEIDRQPGFQGEVQLQMAATQARYLCGSRGLGAVIPPQSTTCIFPTLMTEGTATEYTMRMAVLGVAAVPDPKGNLRYLTKPADAQITMIMEGALLKLSADPHESRIRPGETVHIPVRVLRSDKLLIPIRIELDVPTELRNLMRCNKIELDATTNTGMLKIEMQDGVALSGSWPLMIRAEGLQDGRWPVVSEVELNLEFVR